MFWGSEFYSPRGPVLYPWLTGRHRNAVLPYLSFEGTDQADSGTDVLPMAPHPVPSCLPFSIKIPNTVVRKNVWCSDWIVRLELNRSRLRSPLPVKFIWGAFGGPSQFFSLTYMVVMRRSGEKGSQLCCLEFIERKESGMEIEIYKMVGMRRLT